MSYGYFGELGRGAVYMAKGRRGSRTLLSVLMQIQLTPIYTNYLL